MAGSDLGDINLIDKYASKSSTYKNKSRPMLSRKLRGSMEILYSLEPGKLTEGCLVCCASPACCPFCSVFPCCGESVEVAILKDASSYIHLRENSIEWNIPEVYMKPGLCCGIDPCSYTVRDKVSVMYYDDLLIDNISDQTRCCNELRTCLFGGRGERISLNNTICFGFCARAAFPYFCVPSCCPKSTCPCILGEELYLEDAQQGIYDITKVIKMTYEDKLYTSSSSAHSSL